MTTNDPRLCCAACTVLDDYEDYCGYPHCECHYGIASMDGDEIL